MGKIGKKLRALNDLVMFKHSVFSLPFIFIAMIVSANGWFGWALLLKGLLAAVSARNFAMAYNRYADYDIDSINPRTKDRPLVDGRVSKKLALFFIIANAFIFIITAYLINSLAFYLSFPILVLLALYSHFKRFSESAHLFLGLTLGLAPLAGTIAISASTPLWSYFLSIGVMFWVAGFDILYSLQDMEFDKKEGLFSIPALYGAKCSLFISLVFHLLTVLFWLFFAITAQLGFFAYLAVGISLFVLLWEQKIVREDFEKIDRAFFTLNGYLGFVILGLIILDVTI